MSEKLSHTKTIKADDGKKIVKRDNGFTRVLVYIRLGIVLVHNQGKSWSISRFGVKSVQKCNE